MWADCAGIILPTTPGAFQIKEPRRNLMSSSQRLLWVILFVPCLLGSLLLSSAGAVEITGIQTFSLDQPKTYAMLERPGQAGPLTDSFGAFTFDAFLDTGASGVIISREVAEFVGVQKQQIAGQDVEFLTVGATGTAGFDISEKLNLGLAPFHPNTPLDDAGSIATTYTQRITNVRTQIDQAYQNDLTQPLINVIGMPALENKVVVMDPRPLDLLDNELQMKAYIYDPATPFRPNSLSADPGIPATSHNVELSFGDFSRFTSVTPSAGELPELARNPFIGPDPIAALDPNAPADNTPPVSLSFGNMETSASFLLDTGASVSFVSRALATEFNIRYRPGSFGTQSPTLEIFDPNSPGQQGTPLTEQFQLGIAGVGGATTLAGFYVDTMRLSTIEGDANNPNDPKHLEFIRTPVLINDVQLMDPNSGNLFTIDGVFGMNNLVASANLNPGVGLVDESPSNFDWVVYNDADGSLGFSLKPRFGDFDGSGLLDCGDIDGLVSALSAGANNTTYDMDGNNQLNQNDLDSWLTEAGSLHGDVNLDGVVNGGDLNEINSNLFSNGTSWCSGDLNADGSTDGSDFNEWLGQNGASAASTAAVPEPSSVSFLIFAAFGMILRARR